ncbi:nitroreductase family protein [Paenibacillus sp. V4I7]
MISTIDAALAAQNAAVAAESLGLGIVYIGGIRDKPKEISELLLLPK